MQGGTVKSNSTHCIFDIAVNDQNAEVIDYIASFGATLQAVRNESNVCIIAAITDLLLAGGDHGTVSASIDPILNSRRTKIFSFCAAKFSGLQL